MIYDEIRLIYDEIRLVCSVSYLIYLLLCVMIGPWQTNRLILAANELMEAVQDPWNNVEVRINQRQAGTVAAGMQLQREWTKDEDRYLLCLTHQ